MLHPLEKKVVLVTGAGVRVGQAIAEGLGNLGGKVALHCNRSVAGAEGLAGKLRAAGRTAEVFQADLTDVAALRRMVGEVEAKLGAVDVLVNSAAVFHRVPLGETEPALFDAQWALNGRAPYFLAQAVAKGMVARGRGDIVNIVDVGGVYRPWKNYSAYCMTKAALASLTEVLAVELAPAVRVNAVAPGPVMLPEDYTAEEAAKLAQRLPMKRLGAPSDVVEAVVFLLTGPQFMTGQTVIVDGGARWFR